MAWKLAEEADSLNPVIGDIYLDSTGRMVWEEESTEAQLRARVNQALLMIKGEWYQDLNQGVPYLEYALGVKNPSIQRIQTMIANALSKVPGVAGVLYVRVGLDNVTRESTIDYAIQAQNNKVYTSKDWQPLYVKVI